MQLNYLALAIPFFLLFMGAEYLYTRRKGKNFFQFAESVANLNVGVAERLTDILTTGAFYFVFNWVYTHTALFVIHDTIITWVILFLLTDLVWYWYHRLAHEVNLFWAAHVVHHQSEDFNYTVSARITLFQALIRGLFWSCLPLLGFPPLMVTSLLLIHGLYPFFIHTRALGKWGWLEKILVTPTHHGIHHASNPEYLDKNYGDVLIIWDKIFGTFQEEKPTVRISYGLTHPLRSHSFLWQHFHYLLEIYVHFRQARSSREKWGVLFGKPGTMNPRYRQWLERRFLSHRSQPPTTLIRRYITTQTACSLIILFITILFEHYLGGWQLFLLSFFILISLVNTGALLEQKRWIFYLEMIRVMIVLLFIGLQFPTPWMAGCLTVIAFVGIWYADPIRKNYLQVFYRIN